MCFRPPEIKPAKCPHCGTLNPPTRTECQKCGGVLKKEE